jgi:hypothetical protein
MRCNGSARLGLPCPSIFDKGYCEPSFCLVSYLDWHPGINWKRNTFWTPQVRVDPENEIYLFPRINHFYLGAGESVEFFAIPVFSEKARKISGKITGYAAGINRSIPITFECKEGNKLFKVNLSNPQVIIEKEDWYCTNRPDITMSFLMPPGFNESDVISAKMYMNFTPQGPVMPHDVSIFLNNLPEPVWERINIVPEGMYNYSLDVNNLIYANQLNGTMGYNEIREITKHMNQAHYVVSGKVTIRLCLKKLVMWICAPSQSLAEKIPWTIPGIEHSYTNLTVNLTSPLNNTIVNLNQSITIKASVIGFDGNTSDFQKHSEVWATFDPEQNPLQLFDDGKHDDSESNDGIYANTWIPRTEGDFSIIANAENCRTQGISNITQVRVKIDSLMVNLTSPLNNTIVNLNQNITIKASVIGFDGNTSDFRKNSEVSATFDPEQNPLQLFDDGKHDDSESNDGIYANIWIPKTPGNFSIIAKAKDRRIQGTSDTVTIQVIDSCMGGNCSDLVISDLEMLKRTSLPGKVEISINVSNKGKKEAGQFLANLSIGDKTFGNRESDPLPNNSSWHGYWIVDESDLWGNMVRVCADVTNNVQEANEFNNCLEGSYCKCEPPKIDSNGSVISTGNQTIVKKCPNFNGSVITIEIQTNEPENLNFLTIGSRNCTIGLRRAAELVGR